MKIKSLYLKSYGKFEDKRIDLSDSMNLIYGNNEAGKSTVMSFIKAMLYGFEGKGNDLLTNERKKYVPWSGKGACGEIDILTDDGESIRVIREMGKTHKQDKLQALNINNGEEYIYDPMAVVGIGEEAFLKSFYIRQLGTKLSGENEEIAQRLINLAYSGSQDLNYRTAADSLLSEMKEYKALRGSGGRIGELERKINDLNEELRQAEEYRKKIFNLAERERELEQDSKGLTAEITEIENEKSKSDIYEKYILLEQCEKELEELKKQHNAACIEEKNFQNDLETLSEYENMPDAAIFEPIPEIKKKSRYGMLRTVLAAVGMAVFAVLAVYNVFSLIPAAVCSALFGFLLKSEVSGRREADKVQKLHDRVRDELERFGAKDLKDYYDKKSAYDRTKEKHEDAKKLIGELEIKIREIQAQYEEIHAKIGDREKPENVRSSAQLAEDERIADRRLTEILLKKSRIEGLLGAENEGRRTPDIILTDRADAVQELDRAILRHKALSAAYNALETAYLRMSSDFTPIVNKRASEILKEITGKYDDIITNKGFSVIINSGGVKQLGSFSSGTIEQVYMALRLAVTDIIFGCDKPLFIDDAFLLYDTQREQNLLRYLEGRAAQGQQVIIFSCRRPQVSPDANIICLT